MKIHESLLEDLIPKSKTDQHREGHFVYISRIKSKCCPIKYLEVHLKKVKLDISDDKESRLICRMFKTKSGNKISKAKGILYSRIRNIFKDYISEITTTTDKFGPHCLRSGSASAAANNGI